MWQLISSTSYATLDVPVSSGTQVHPHIILDPDSIQTIFQCLMTMVLIITYLH